MHQRIFIAINLPEKIKKELKKFQEKWPTLPVRWVKPDNLHITLAFLGYIYPEELSEVFKVTNEIAKKHNLFFINLKKTIYGPPKKFPPKMVWLEIESNKELVSLKKDLENSLSKKINYSPENRLFSPHITLGRIKSWDFRKIELEEKPQIEEEVNLGFEVKSIEIMESQLKKGGAEYAILESCQLKN